MPAPILSRTKSLTAAALTLFFLFLPPPSFAADWYVSATLGSDATGSGSMAAPYRSISKAVLTAADSDRVLVAEGVYFESVSLSKDLTLLGGYDSLFGERLPSVHRTVIDGEHSANANVSLGYEYSLTMDGFILQNSARGLEMTIGIYPPVTISNNLIRNHSEAGIYIGDSHILNYYAYVNADVYSSNNLIIGNEIGVKTYSATLVVMMCPMAYSSDIFLRSRNDTIAGNWRGILMEASTGCGVLSINRHDIRNSIIWDNEMDNFTEGDGTRVYNYSDIQGGAAGTGNINADPLFFDPHGTDHQLRPGSPAIDAGDPAPAYNDPDGSRNDMGFTGGAAGAWSDRDHDGMGDQWETYYGFNPLDPSDGGLNPDGDDMINRVEFFVGSNPLVADTADCDDDGLPDVAEANYRTETCLPDTDSDSLPDGWEVQHSWCSFNPRALEGELMGLRVTSDPSFSQSPSMAWTGSEFGVSWLDGRDGNYEIYFSRIAAQGTKIGNDLRVTMDASYSYAPSLAWTGSEFGLSWYDNRDGNYEVYFTRVDAQGAKIGSDLRLTANASYSGAPYLVWTGSEFGVSWEDNRDGNNEIYFVRIDGQGAKIGNDLRVTAANYYSEKPSLVWTGSEFGLSWHDSRQSRSEIYFARLDAQGTKAGSDVRITDNDYYYSTDPSLVWTGSEFGVGWQDERDGNYEIYFGRVNAQGTKIVGDHRITNNSSGSYAPSLVWTGSEFGVSWHDSRHGSSEVYFTRVNIQGSKIGSDLRITTDAATSSYPSLVWTGSESGVSWSDNRDGNYEIYFTGLFSSLIYSDKDGDGAREDQEFAEGTDPCDPDSDDDLSPDVFHGAPELCDGVDNQCPGDAGFGVVDEGCAPVDSDGDGLVDSEENAAGTNPLLWDTDGDGLSDYLEHNAPGLDPLNSSDGLGDLDADQNLNVHEIYNGTGINNPDPQGHFISTELGCCYFADADGDGVLGPNDIAGLENDILGLGADYSGVIPPTGFTMDADGDGGIGPGDLSEANNMLLELPLAYIGGRADSLVVLDSPAGPVAAGDTCRVTIGVRNEADLGYAQGFAVIFEVVSGDAAILGGDGSASFAAPGNRYDFSGASGSSSIVVRPNATGTITLDAYIPACGTPGVGRSCAEINLVAPVIIVTP